MEDNAASPLVLDGAVRDISFSLATSWEICTSSADHCPIINPRRLTNPFLGLPLESGKCEACGTAEHGQCEGHFGYVELPVPIYHPCHVSELKQILNLVCLKCLRMKKGKVKQRLEGKTHSSSCLYCRGLPPIFVNELKTTDDAFILELKALSKESFRDGFWNFLERYGFRYGDSYCRRLLPCEALNILKEIPEETRRKLANKGYHPQHGFIMQYLPVPPNCLYSPDFTDGKSIMSSDISLAMLRRVLSKIDFIKRSRSGSPNFESHEAESDDLQAAISLYMHLRGTPKAPHDTIRRFVPLELREVSTKQWLEKVRTLFIRKSSGFSSRSVITGDTYKGVHEIGLPLEIAMKVTFEEKVTAQNMRRLQEIVDNRQCLTFRDGSFTYAITVGSKGHTFLKVGQVVHRRIMDGDIIFVNRPPSTHKHSLQAFSVYVHDDRTVKINPLVCGPLGADFDGDCIHIFYPQSLAAKAEALMLFSVEQQLLSSHNDALNLQLVQDSLLALKLMQRTCFLMKTTAQQLGMFACSSLPPPALLRAVDAGPFWTVRQILQSALPHSLDCCGERYLIQQGEILFLDFERENLQSTLTEIVTSILFLKGQKEALQFFNLLQPLLMEFLFLEGFSISLLDFNLPKYDREDISKCIEVNLPLLHQLRKAQCEFIESQVENNLKSTKITVVNFILRCSSLGYLIDSKSDSTLSKVVQQLGFLGLQLSDKGKLYSPALVDDIVSHLMNKCSVEDDVCPTKAYGLIGNSFFHGLDPCEVFVHSVGTREVIIRSSGGLTEPGTLFKNLMSILRDVVVCYDGTVRNVCTNMIILFGCGADDSDSTLSYLPAGEPVGVLAATAISNPAYKAVLDSSQSTNSSWELMKEALLCKVNFKNDAADRRVILFMNDCFCGKRFCKERAAIIVCSFLNKVMLRDFAVDFSIEYQRQILLRESSEMVQGLMGHIHLSQLKLDELNCKVDEIYQKCLDVIRSYGKKRSNISCAKFFRKMKEIDKIFRKITLYSSECCNWDPHKPCYQVSQSPCLQFFFHDRNPDPCVEDMENELDIMVNTVCPVLLNTVIKGDPRVHSAKIVWIGPDTIPRVRTSSKTAKGQVAVEIVIEKDMVKQNGDAWRVAIDSCVPVMHLIDTRRSIPYGIKQIQEHLGISSAFDQAILRLSTAVRSVSKGVLKQHLMLVVHCMTCSGNVIGFNTAGFKALFHSLKVQVPFTEATLFTPLKCFERAADKCYRDSLSSVVAACSWGKHVATGTGAHFQIMWNKKQMSDLEDVDKDVYSFLQLVRETSSERHKSTAFRRVDVDDVVDADFNLSPEPDLNFGKCTFEEGPEEHSKFEDRLNLESGKLGNSGWENVASTVQSDNWQQWGGEKQLKDQHDMPPIGADSWQQWGNEKQFKFHDQNDMPVIPEGQSGGCQQWGNEKQHKFGNQNDIPVTPEGKTDSRFSSWDNIQSTIKLSDPSDTWRTQGSKDEEFRRDQASISHDGVYWDKNAKKRHLDRQQSPVWGTTSSKNKYQNEHAPSFKSESWTVQSSNEESSRAFTYSSGWHNRPQDRRDRTMRSHGWGSWNISDQRANRNNLDDQRGRDTIGNVTSTWRRAEFFNCDEEKIIVEVEPIMQSIKRILHQSSYCDGNRLSADDQCYILDNVFRYHPDRNAKVGGEVDYIMVDKHRSFPESRCFFVVSTDGSSSDFSYIKCMENFIKEKYPENAESFNRKYFRRRRADTPNESGQRL